MNAQHKPQTSQMQGGIQTAQPQQPVPVSAPRVVVPHDPSEDIPQLLIEMEDWFTTLKRSMAAFSALKGSFLSLTNQLPEGERRRGLPVFEFSAPLIGKETREAIKCVIDLRRIDQNYVGHVLVPIINAQAGEILESVEEIAERVALLRPILHAMTGGGPPASGDPMAATPPA